MINVNPKQLTNTLMKKKFNTAQKDQYTEMNSKNFLSWTEPLCSREKRERRKEIFRKADATKNQLLYGARLGLVNFPRRFCVPLALGLRNRKKCLGDIFFAEQMSKRIGEANLESLQERAMRWSPKAAQGNSPKMTAPRIQFPL